MGDFAYLIPLFQGHTGGTEGVRRAKVCSRLSAVHVFSEMCTSLKREHHFGSQQGSASERLPWRHPAGGPKRVAMGLRRAKVRKRVIRRGRHKRFCIPYSTFRRSHWGSGGGPEGKSVLSLKRRACFFRNVHGIEARAQFWGQQGPISEQSLGKVPEAPGKVYIYIYI